MIPKIIHFVWIGSKMPIWAEINIRLFRKLNPDYEVRIHGREICQELEKASGLITGIHKLSETSDLIRLTVLKNMGGWYFDTDFMPFRPIDDIIKQYDLENKDFFIAKATDNCYANGLIGAGKGSYMIEQIVKRVEDKAYHSGYTGWGCFGTIPMTDVCKENPDKVVIGNPKDFFPIPDWEKFKIVSAYIKLITGEPSIKMFPGNPFMLHFHCQDSTRMEDI